MPSAIPSRQQWLTMTRGKPAAAELDRCTALVFAYHLRPAGDVEERLRIVNDILGAARGYLEANGVVAPLSSVVGQLALAAEKEQKTIAKASRGWGAARKVFAPSGSPHGPTRTVQHRLAAEAEPTSVKNYWLEALDPRHRSWGHMDRHIFDDWLASPTELSFWEWLEATGRADVAGVQYLAPDERWKYWIVFGDDRRLYRHDPSLGPRGAGKPTLQVFTTRGMSTAFSGSGFAIWVCSPGGIFYSASHEVSHFHHSSFLAGGRVLAAGEWVVHDGTIQLITHKTGHYLASPQNLLRALWLLQPRTDLSRTVVAQTNYATGQTRYVKAVDFVRAGGNAARCEAVKDEQGAAAASAGEAIRRVAGYAAYVFVN